MRWASVRAGRESSFFRSLPPDWETVFEVFDVAAKVPLGVQDPELVSVVADTRPVGGPGILLFWRALANVAE
eukprot:4511239-Lingulodinium_polyedra.AAC.1